MHTLPGLKVSPGQGPCRYFSDRVSHAGGESLGVLVHTGDGYIIILNADHSKTA